jgi:hypothetical protein
MFELLFIVALVAWLAINCLEYLAGLPAAPTLAAAALIWPFLVVWRTRVLARSGRIEFVRSRRRPLPPERFYWPATRRRLGWRAALGSAAGAIAWPVALGWPARWAVDTASITGWISAVIGILAVAEAVAGAWLYVRASQRIHHLAPTALGWLRVGLYRLSDNHEFLGEEPLPRQKRVRESVY